MVELFAPISCDGVRRQHRRHLRVRSQIAREIWPAKNRQQPLGLLLERHDLLVQAGFGQHDSLPPENQVQRVETLGETLDQDLTASEPTRPK